MSQIYLQRFEYRGAIDRAVFDATWGIAHEAMAKTGNWGGVKTGIKHLHGYGTSWGGFALIEVEDPRALVEYPGTCAPDGAQDEVDRYFAIKQIGPYT